MYRMKYKYYDKVLRLSLVGRTIADCRVELNQLNATLVRQHHFGRAGAELNHQLDSTQRKCSSPK